MMVRQASADARDAHTAIYPSPVSLQNPAPPPPHQAGYMMPSPGQNMPTPAFPAPHTATINQQQQQQQQSFLQQQVWDTICLNVNVFCPNTHTWGLCIRPLVLLAVFTVFRLQVWDDGTSHGGVLCSCHVILVTDAAVLLFTQPVPRVWTAVSAHGLGAVQRPSESDAPCTRAADR